MPEILRRETRSLLHMSQQVRLVMLLTRCTLMSTKPMVFDLGEHIDRYITGEYK